MKNIPLKKKMSNAKYSNLNLYVVPNNIVYKQFLI